jgi:uncharacterized membrane protein YccC
VTEPILKEVAADFAEGLGMVGKALRSLGQDLVELGADRARSRQGLIAALVVPLSVVLALALQVDSVWWAATSGFMTLQATGPASLLRGMRRLGGTIAGAALGFVAARWLPYDHPALDLFIATTTIVGVVGMFVSPHGLAWLFSTITVIMVLLSGLTDPLVVPGIAVSRVVEVAIGVVVAAVVTNVIEPEDDGAAAVVPPGWRHLLGAQWPVLLHGARAAIAIIIMLHAWILLDLPSMSQMAVTISVVMAVPGGPHGELATRHAVAERALHRVMGCLLGGIIGLFCLALSVTTFLPWLLMIGGGIWLCMHFQTSKRGVTYIGTQAGMVFIVTVIQGWAPADSILPGIDRFVGITGGLLILQLVSLLMWPSEARMAGEGKPEG